MSEPIFEACKQLIDDAKTGCADLVFKEICLEILSRASHVLSQRQFKQLVAYADEKMREKTRFKLQQEVALNR
ncbi:MAG: hypothetical protein WBV70_00460 [Candidatus Bathyarchaeia archaeon]